MAISSRIGLCWSLVAMAYNARKIMLWNRETEPHVAIGGTTGSGKTYASLWFLACISMALPLNAQFVVADYKGGKDFAFLNGCELYFRYNDCSKALDLVHKALQTRQADPDAPRDFLMFFFDEFSSYISSLDTKVAKIEMAKMADILRLGREMGIHVMISQQRLDAEFFSGGVRDCIGLVVVLGNMTPVARDMLFADFKKDIVLENRRGQGYWLAGGRELERIFIPPMNNLEFVHRVIRVRVK